LRFVPTKNPTKRRREKCEEEVTNSQGDVFLGYRVGSRRLLKGLSRGNGLKKGQKEPRKCRGFT
jgi:hypothetical protein